ncbi:MAG: cell division protein FtsZ, partial [Acetobacteraceae bacterium]|nr:cell division protein FtsZ [Acetobacteraceae bacterium]
VVNLDFADIRTVMAEMGKAMMGPGEADGDDRAVKAAEAAISNPLLEDTSLRGARGVLINITGGLDMTLFEVDEAANRIRKEVDEDANIIFGSSVEDDLNGRIRVSVVATGIDAAVVAQPAGQAAAPAQAQQRPETLTLVPGGSRPAAGRPPVMTSPIVPPSAAGPRRVGIGGISAAASPMVLRAPASQSSPTAASLGPVAVPSPEEAEGVAQHHAAYPSPHPVEPGRRPAGPVGAAASTVPNVGNGLRRIFREMTGGGMMRRDQQAAPQSPAAPTPQQQYPGPAPRQAAQPAQQRPPQPDEMGLDIPTFLRRQSNN